MDGLMSLDAEGRPVRPSERIDEACDRFEAAWRAGAAPRIEDYLAETEEADRPVLLRELVALERELRRGGGERPETEEYLDRFAGDASVIAAALQETTAPFEGPADSSAVTMTGDTEPSGTDGKRRLPDALHAAAVYRPRRHHAQGGLGEVLAAHQDELDRTVALKRIRPDRLHDAARRRFLREAALTARLQHPGIVPIYGLGHDEDGPFYTMPFIEGQTLQQALDAFHGDDASARDPGRRALKFRGLLQQFIAACNTMAYAHDQGVIHRDLKPSNIMLGPYGETLVMDWGLAKRVGTDDAGGEAEGDAPSPSPWPEALTTTGTVLGTPHYMSPEQARGEPAGPASDVFSLGLVLYALLTGKSPYADAVLRGGDLQQAVREAAVVPPRRREPGLPGALEAICLKALAVRPGDRYPSARALAEEVEHWLADEPVTAYREPPSVRAGRWMRRHRPAVTGAAAAGIVGLIGLIAAAALQARSNRDLQAALQRAEGVLSFLKDDVLAAARPEGQGGGLGVGVTVHQAVDAAEPKIAGRFKDQPLVEADVRYTLGETYNYLGKPMLAIRQLERAVELRRAKLGPDHLDTLISMNNLANGYADAGQHDRDLKLREETLALMRSKLGPDHPETLGIMSNLANSYYDAGRLDRALKLREETLALQRSKLGPDHPDTLTSMNNLAESYFATGRNDRAIKLYEETLALKRSKLGPDHPHTLTSMNNLANSYGAAGRNDRALKLHEETLALMRSKLGPDHPHTLASMLSLAEMYGAVGRNDRAIKLHEETLALMRSTLGPDHPYTLESLEGQARCLANSGQLDRAGAILDELIASRRKAQGDGHPDALRSRINRADLDLARARLDAAEAADRAILDECRTRLGADDRVTIAAALALARVRSARGDSDSAAPLYQATLESARRNPTNRETLATVLAESGRSRLEAGEWTTAESLLREALAIREVEKPQHWVTAEARSLLGGALMGEKKTAEAAPLLRSGYEGMARSAAAIPLVDRPRLAEALDRLIELSTATNRPDEVQKWQAERARYPGVGIAAGQKPTL
jgi:serine/threonine protein kinase/tetratricopeptide (TPR) repeat protein